MALSARRYDWFMGLNLKKFDGFIWLSKMDLIWVLSCFTRGLPWFQDIVCGFMWALHGFYMILYLFSDVYYHRCGEHS